MIGRQHDPERVVVHVTSVNKYVVGQQESTSFRGVSP